MKDYNDFYFKSTVLLLVDVFQKFRNNDSKIMNYAQVIILAHQA